MQRRTATSPSRVSGGIRPRAFRQRPPREPIRVLSPRPFRRCLRTSIRSRRRQVSSDPRSPPWDWSAATRSHQDDSAKWPPERLYAECQGRKPAGAYERQISSAKSGFEAPRCRHGAAGADGRGSSGPTCSEGKEPASRRRRWRRSRQLPQAPSLRTARRTTTRSIRPTRPDQLPTTTRDSSALAGVAGPTPSAIATSRPRDRPVVPPAHRALPGSPRTPIDARTAHEPHLSIRSAAYEVTTSPATRPARRLHVAAAGTAGSRRCSSSSSRRSRGGSALHHAAVAELRPHLSACRS